MKSLTKEEILGANDLQREVVEVPEWGGTVTVQEMSALRRIELEGMLADKESDKRLRVLMVAFSAVDEAGEMLFTPEEVGKLGKKNFNAIRRVSDAAFRVNQARQADLEVAQRNLASSQGEGSLSA